MFRFVYIANFALMALMALCVYTHVRALAPVKRLRARSKPLNYLSPLPAALAAAYLAREAFSTSWICVMYLCCFLLAGDFIALIMRLIPRAGALCEGLKKWLARGLAFALALVFICYGIANMRAARRTVYDVRANNLAGDMKLMLISDLHLGAVYDADAFMEKLAIWIDGDKPDALILAGDIIDESTDASEAEKLYAALKPICAQTRVYAVLGNHDGNNYGGGISLAALDDMMRGAGITVLNDDILPLADGAWIAGRRDAYARARASADKLIGARADDFVLLIDHQPRETLAAARAGADIMLSGHTHDGQIWPVGIISKLLNYWDFTYGKTQVEDMTLIVTSGVAGWRCAIRTEGVSEYVIINVRGNAE